MSNSSQNPGVATHMVVGEQRPALRDSRSRSVDVDALTERVYRLLADELRLELERRGCPN